MDMSREKTNEYVKRLLLSRMRLLSNHGFYGLLLMHMKFAIDDSFETAATNGERISFNPEFLESLSDRELDFILMHEVLHVALQHCLRVGDKDKEQFNIACDIVVNSNILKENDMKISSITLYEYGESMHLAPDGKEGYNYTAEQVYGMIGAAMGNKCNDNQSLKENVIYNKDGKGQSATWDDHSQWGSTAGNNKLKEIWTKRLMDAAEAISIKDPSNSRSLLPLCVQRLIKELTNPQTDWRTILSEFVQEEICDYSFSPPDRRFGDSPFFLPDFNEKEDRVEDILFMIDTSASMSDDMIALAYSEVKGAIDQFDGKLKGWLGFFDAAVTAPVEFVDEESLLSILPRGGGGTSFHVIFDYVKEFMSDKKPASIVILTDGYAPWPDESDADDIPVLWIINNEETNPPWGKVARLRV